MDRGRGPPDNRRVVKLHRKATRADSFHSEVRHRFGPSAAKWGMSGPVDDDRIVQSVSYRLGSLSYQWVHDDGINVVIALDEDGVRHSIWLEHLVVAAGLGVARDVRTDGRTWRAVQQAIESQTEWLERLHPHLSGPDAIAFLDTVGARQS
jgi:hypothetical protein